MARISDRTSHSSLFVEENSREIRSSRRLVHLNSHQLLEGGDPSGVVNFAARRGGVNASINTDHKTIFNVDSALF